MWNTPNVACFVARTNLQRDEEHDDGKLHAHLVRTFFLEVFSIMAHSCHHLKREPMNTVMGNLIAAVLRVVNTFLAIYAVCGRTLHTR
jgi:hypothetical protein